jgi:hypothetical protein
MFAWICQRVDFLTKPIDLPFPAAEQALQRDTTQRRMGAIAHHPVEQQLCRWLLLSLDRLPHPS